MDYQQRIADNARDNDRTWMVGYACGREARRSIPRCQACGCAVGDCNPVRDKVGSIITGCQTCVGDRRGR